jgi:hypothetical protein
MCACYRQSSEAIILANAVSMRACVNSRDISRVFHPKTQAPHDVAAAAVGCTQESCDVAATPRLVMAMPTNTETARPPVPILHDLSGGIHDGGCVLPSLLPSARTPTDSSCGMGAGEAEKSASPDSADGCTAQAGQATNHTDLLSNQSNSSGGLQHSC